MKKKIVGYISSFALGAAVVTSLTVAHATPDQVGSAQASRPRASAPSGPLQHPDALNIARGVRLHMSRDAVASLAQRSDVKLLDLKYDASAQVSFVAGTALFDGRVPLLDDEETTYLTMKSWGPPTAQGMVGADKVRFYRTGDSLLIVRLTPDAVPSRRSDGTYTFALASGVGWIPYSWGHDVIAQVSAH